jgi:hypothetical protein
MMNVGEIILHSQMYLLSPKGSAFPPWYSMGFTRAEKAQNQHLIRRPIAENQFGFIKYGYNSTSRFSDPKNYTVKYKVVF